VQSLNIQIVDEPALAPNYRNDHPAIEMATITNCVVVGKGTEAGLATVDFQITHANGTLSVAMLTGSLVKGIAAAVAGCEARTNPPPVSNIPPHQQRVLDEKRELDEKRGKLTAFQVTPLFASLPGEERDRLVRQLAAMTTYSDILSDRIAAFPTAG
jgi:hypothetical protein